MQPGWKIFGLKISHVKSNRVNSNKVERFQEHKPTILWGSLTCNFNCVNCLIFCLSWSIEFTRFLWTSPLNPRPWKCHQWHVDLVLSKSEFRQNMFVHSRDTKVKNGLTDKRKHAQTHITMCNDARTASLLYASSSSNSMQNSVAIVLSWRTWLSTDTYHYHRLFSQSSNQSIKTS